MSKFVDTIPMAEVRAANARAGRDDFAPSILQFMGAKLPRVAYRGPGGIFFVVRCQPLSGEGRRYRVRFVLWSLDTHTGQAAPVRHWRPEGDERRQLREAEHRASAPRRTRPREPGARDRDPDPRSCTRAGPSRTQSSLTAALPSHINSPSVARQSGAV